jgi:aryl-alcohol dehydrogenase-like predicted oxidoreductase
MAYRMLGPTGNRVSVLSYGFWAPCGVKEGLTGKGGVQRSKTCLQRARLAGVNRVDNAEAYGNPMGAAETVMGEAIRQLTLERPAPG